MSKKQSNKKRNHDSLWIMRHSAEHVLHQAMVELFPGLIRAMGPATDQGFYHDFDYDKKISEEDFSKIEKRMQQIIDKNLPITRQEISINEARKMFKNNPYKLDWIDRIEKKNQKVTIYWTGQPNQPGSDVDLCSGPHVKSTGEIKAFKLLSVAGAYWHGDEKNKMLTRVYGTAFPSKKELKKHLHNLEEAKKRDHKKLGPQLELFFFHQTAPGMPYWLPKGTIVYNELLRFWREEHHKRGYLETITPLLNKKELYQTSGHWEHYNEHMFICKTEDKQTYCVKPMNCPNAVTLYQFKKHSYKELPLRFSDCDALHRNEKSGELSGLLRVQKFAQDDAHIFITEDQILSEYKNILEITDLFYSVFGLKFKISLGTRPDDFMGDIKTWSRAEKDLENILKKLKLDYIISKKDGTFYGPKLDIRMNDCMGRQWQTGTIQLDFQIPKNFKLKYTDPKGEEKTPVVIHRVIYGSLERFIGILIEHFAGAFPVWLSPVQVQVIPIADDQLDYSKKVVQKLTDNNIRVEIDSRSETMQNKIRQATNNKVPFMLIIGQREVESNTVSVRQRDGQDLKSTKLDDFIQKINRLIDNKALNLIK